MILAHPTLEKMIEFDGSSVQILVIESPAAMAKCLDELSLQITGLPGSFSIFEKNELIFYKTVKLIFNPFELSRDDKEIISGIIERIRITALDEDHYIHTNQLLSDINKTINELAMDVDIDLESKDIKIAELLKISSLGFYDESDSIVDRICNYLDCLQAYTSRKLIIFVNLKCYLSDSDYSLFLKHIVYRKHNVLLIESRTTPHQEYESVRIIDRDLCEIHSSPR